jgi:ABC-type lipoprotein export system ATPase subunit
MSAVIEARGLRKVHGSGAAEVVALHDLDLDLGQGEFLAVTGPSGCGKSTCSTCSAGSIARPRARSGCTASGSTTPASRAAPGCGGPRSGSCSSSST